MLFKRIEPPKTEKLIHDFLIIDNKRKIREDEVNRELVAQARTRFCELFSQEIGDIDKSIVTATMISRNHYSFKLSIAPFTQLVMSDGYWMGKLDTSSMLFYTGTCCVSILGVEWHVYSFDWDNPRWYGPFKLGDAFRCLVEIGAVSRSRKEG